MKSLILIFSLFLFAEQHKEVGSSATSQTEQGKGLVFSIDIKKSGAFKNAELEALYTVYCTNIKTKNTRVFKIIKTDKRLKNYFLADFIIIESSDSSQKYYPVGWESTVIKESDIKTDCLSILNGFIKPVDEKEI